MSLLYLISPPNINFDQFPDLLAAIFAESNNSIGAFQLRVKNRSVEDIFDISKILLPICKSYNIDYYINDHYKIADKLEIDGIHLGQDDGNIVKICQTYGRNFKIGISCMNSIELAFKAQKLGVNYVSFGAFFPTNTKKNTKSAKLRLLQDWQKQSSLPCAAIGGINQNNIRQIAKHKPYYICLISAIWSATNPILVVQKITQLLKNLA